MNPKVKVEDFEASGNKRIDLQNQSRKRKHGVSTPDKVLEERKEAAAGFSRPPSRTRKKPNFRPP